MPFYRPFVALALLMALPPAFAVPADVTLSHLTVGNYRDHGDGSLSAVNVISDNGRVAVLGLDWAGGTLLEQTDNQGVYRGHGFTADFTPAAGYAVSSITLSGYLEMERVNQPPEFDEWQNWLRYSQYILGDGFADGWSSNSAPGEDTLLSATVELTPGEHDDLDKFSKPFFVELVTNSQINGYSPVPGPAPYASMMWRDVTVRIEMVPVAAVPEPGTWMMLLAGLAGIGMATRRRQS